MNNGIPPGARMLDKPTVQINQWRIVPAAVLGVGAGSVAHIDCPYYVQFIDVGAGVGLLIPYERKALADLRDNINTILEGSNAHGAEQGS